MEPITLKYALPSQASPLSGFAEDGTAPASPDCNLSLQSDQIVQVLWLRYLCVMAADEISAKLDLPLPLVRQCISEIQKALDRIAPELP